MTVVILTSGTSYSLPSDWNPLSNTVEAIAGGGSGAAGSSTTPYGGGGGGAYAILTNLSDAALTSETIAIGSGGARPGSAGSIGQPGTITTFKNSTTLKADFGHGTDASAAAAGGLAANCVPTSGAHSGGTGGDPSAQTSVGGPAGAGAGGPNGAGAHGGGEDPAGDLGGAGGGGNGGGSVGGDSAGPSGSAGGNNSASSGSGAGATSSASPGSPGTNGGGGGGGFGANGGQSSSGGAGGAGIEWTTAGSGGGGGGGGAKFNTTGTSGAGAAGGLYGGGGGSSGSALLGGATYGLGGNGAQGVIVVTYTPPSTGKKPKGIWPLIGLWTLPTVGLSWIIDRRNKLGKAAAIVMACVLPLTGWTPLQRGGGTVVSGPDQTRYMMVGGRFRIDSTAVNAGTAGLNMLSRAAIITPKWACKNPRLVFVNWWGRETTTPPEVDGANTITIDGASIEVASGSTFTSLTFSGVASATIAAGGVLISDAITGVTLNANSNAGSYYARTSVTVASSGNSFPGFLNLNGTLTGEHASLAASLGAQSWSLTGGTPAGSQTRAYGPVTVLCQGWDGSPVVLSQGDSIDYGKGDIITASRGTLGYVARGLDDSGSGGGSYAYTIWAIAGQSAAAASEGAATNGHYGRRFAAVAAMAALNTASALPFTTAYVEHGTNDGSNIATDVPAFWSMDRTAWPTAYVMQSTLTPHTDDSVAGDSSCVATNVAGGDFCWTDTAHQSSSGTPYNAGGIVSTFNTNLKNGTYSCPTGAPQCVDGVIDITSQIWTSLTGCQAGTQANCTWIVPSFTTTLSSACNAGVNSCNMNAAPAVGDDIVFEPGVANLVEAYKSGGNDGGGYVVTTVTGTGPFTVTFTGSSGTLQFNHSIGAAIAEANSTSGLHPNVHGAVTAANGVIAAKNSSVFK